MFRCNNEMRFDGPCQDAGEGFGFQEESKVVAPTWHAYCFEFGVPCDCSQGFTAAGHFPQTSSVVMWTRLASEADHPRTSLPECVGIDAGVCSSTCGGGGEDRCRRVTPLLPVAHGVIVPARLTIHLFQFSFAVYVHSSNGAHRLVAKWVDLGNEHYFGQDFVR